MPLEYTSLAAITEFPVVYADESGCITHVNAAFTTVFEWTESEIIGQPLSVLIPPALRDAHNLGFSRLVTTGQQRILQTPIPVKALNKREQEVSIEICITAQHLNNIWQFGAILKPLSVPDATARVILET